MRSSAPWSVAIPADTAWPRLIHGLSLLAATGLVAWISLWADLDDPAVWIGCAAAVLILGWAAAHASARPVHLRWDGSQWLLGSLAGWTTDEVPGRLRVMLDLSVALLLRFDAGAPGGAGRCWIPVRRVSLGAGWPVLRRAVYSAPPWPGGQTSGNGPHTETTRPD